MSRKGSRYKGKTCPYCGELESTSTRDHVIARSFISKDIRGEGIIVPSCEPCNNHKAELEAYSTIVIPMNRDADKDAQLTAKSKLLNNQKLLRHVSQDIRRTLYKTDSGIYVPSMAVTVDWRAIDDLHRFIAAGLFYHHTGRAVDWDRYCAIVSSVPNGMDDDLKLSINDPNTDRFSGNISKGTFTYSGVVFKSDPMHSLWNMNIHNMKTSIKGNNPNCFLTYVEFAPRWIVIAMPPPQGSEQHIFDHPEVCRYKPLEPSSLVYRRRQRWIDAGESEYPSKDEMESALRFQRLCNQSLIDQKS